MGNYFSKLAESSKDKGLVVADLSKLANVDYGASGKKNKKEKTKNKKNERRKDKNY